jgi:hypothetical protein
VFDCLCVCILFILPYFFSLLRSPCRLSVYPFWLFLGVVGDHLYLCVFVFPLNFFVFDAVCIVWKESKRLVLRRTSGCNVIWSLMLSPRHSRGLYEDYSVAPFGDHCIVSFTKICHAICCKETFWLIVTTSAFCFYFICWRILMSFLEQTVTRLLRVETVAVLAIEWRTVRYK